MVDEVSEEDVLREPFGELFEVRTVGALDDKLRSYYILNIVQTIPKEKAKQGLTERLQY